MSRRAPTRLPLPALALLLAVVPARAWAQDTADMLADTVRDRGFRCEQAEAAERDEALSRPDEAVWVLRCSNGRYRVRYPGDTAPQVEPLE
jgi:hypothetical protein